MAFIRQILPPGGAHKRGFSAQSEDPDKRNPYVRNVPILPDSKVPPITALLVFAAILLVAIVQSGCSGVTSARSNSTSTSSGAASSATLSTSPAAITFGSVPVGSSGNQSLTVTNSGSSPVTISQATATGTGFSVAGASLPSTLLPGNSSTFTATFAPATTG